MAKSNMALPFLFGNDLSFPQTLTQTTIPTFRSTRMTTLGLKSYSLWGNSTTFSTQKYNMFFSSDGAFNVLDADFNKVIWSSNEYSKSGISTPGKFGEMLNGDAQVLITQSNIYIVNPTSRVSYMFLNPFQDLKPIENMRPQLVGNPILFYDGFLEFKTFYENELGEIIIGGTFVSSLDNSSCYFVIWKLNFKNNTRERKQIALPIDITAKLTVVSESSDSLKLILNSNFPLIATWDDIYFEYQNKLYRRKLNDNLNWKPGLPLNQLVDDDNNQNEVRFYWHKVQNNIAIEGPRAMRTRVIPVYSNDSLSNFKWILIFQLYLRQHGLSSSQLFRIEYSLDDNSTVHLSDFTGSNFFTNNCFQRLLLSQSPTWYQTNGIEPLTLNLNGDAFEPPFSVENSILPYLFVVYNDTVSRYSQSCLELVYLPADTSWDRGKVISKSKQLLRIPVDSLSYPKKVINFCKIIGVFNKYLAIEIEFVNSPEYNGYYFFNCDNSSDYYLYQTFYNKSNHGKVQSTSNSVNTEQNFAKSIGEGHSYDYNDWCWFKTTVGDIFFFDSNRSTIHGYWITKSDYGSHNDSFKWDQLAMGNNHYSQVNLQTGPVRDCLYTFTPEHLSNLPSIVIKNDGDGEGLFLNNYRQSTKTKESIFKDATVIHNPVYKNNNYTQLCKNQNTGVLTITGSNCDITNNYSDSTIPTVWFSDNRWIQNFDNLIIERSDNKIKMVDEYKTTILDDMADYGLMFASQHGQTRNISIVNKDRITQISHTDDPMKTVKVTPFGQTSEELVYYKKPYLHSYDGTQLRRFNVEAEANVYPVFDTPAVIKTEWEYGETLFQQSSIAINSLDIPSLKTDLLSIMAKNNDWMFYKNVNLATGIDTTHSVLIKTSSNFLTNESKALSNPSKKLKMRYYYNGQELPASAVQQFPTVSQYQNDSTFSVNITVPTL